MQKKSMQKKHNSVPQNTVFTYFVIRHECWCLKGTAKKRTITEKIWIHLVILQA